jgi:hypothetical protein
LCGSQPRSLLPGCERVFDVLEPWAHGTIVRATRYPSYFDFNVVRVEQDRQ